MVRRFTIVASMIGCLLLWAAVAAPAAEDILKLVPESALGFVVLNRPADLDAKLQSLARGLQLPPLSALAMLKQQCGIQDGLDEHGTVGLIVLPPKGDNEIPGAVLLIPVTDYEKFIKPFQPREAKEETTLVQIFNTNNWVRNIGGYAAISDQSHRELLFKRNLKIAKEPAAALAPWQQWLAGKDVAAVLLPPGLKMVSTKGQEAIRAMKAIFESQSGEQFKMAAAGFDLYAYLLQAAQKEVATAGIGLDVDKQNVVRLTKRLLLVPGGECAKLVADWKAPSQSPLAGLPDEPFVVAGGGAVTDTMYEQLMKFSFNMMKNMRETYGLSDEQIEKLAKTHYQIRELKETRAVSMSIGVGKSDQPLYSGMIMLMRVRDSQAYMKEYEKSLAQYREVVKDAKSPMLPAIDVEHSKVGDIPALQIAVTMPALVSEQMPGPAKNMIEKMLGPGGKLVGWFAPADKETVVFGYIDKKHVLETIKAIKQGKPGLAGNAGVVKTAALLPPHATLVANISPAGVVAFVKRAVAGVLPPEAAANLKLPEFPKTPPIGMAVTTGPNELQACVAVPFEVMKGIAQYVGKIRAGQGQ